jgi:uracil phosphoribosyltransferase
VLYSTDSPEVFSNKSKILFADPSLASGSTVSQLLHVRDKSTPFERYLLLHF